MNYAEILAELRTFETTQFPNDVEMKEDLVVSTYDALVALLQRLVEAEAAISKPCPVCKKPLGNDEVYHAGYDYDSYRTIPPIIGRGQYCDHIKKDPTLG